ncbi:hypothetical protein [Limosilactobacillus allomucosae]|uniref:hypothetical protein n=1 Tax=Limosilactobacillus allomucosae TaxID=3142938 RepID=UPI003267A805
MVTDHKTAESADRLNWMAKVFSDLYQMPLPFKQVEVTRELITAIRYFVARKVEKINAEK